MGEITEVPQAGKVLFGLNLVKSKSVEKNFSHVEVCEKNGFATLE